MKYWLNIPCKELKREWLLDEHMSIHAYFGGMSKNPERWIKHPLIGPMDAHVLFRRHQEQVREMDERGYKHTTPIRDEIYDDVVFWREQKGLQIGDLYDKHGFIIRNEEMRQLQLDYLKEVNA
jgi:Pyrimidine dimer DNA glycosylase